MKADGGKLIEFSVELCRLLSGWCPAVRLLECLQHPFRVSEVLHTDCLSLSPLPYTSPCPFSASIFSSHISSACDYLFADVLHLRAGCVYSNSATIICCGHPVPLCLDTVGAALWYSVAVASQVWVLGWQPPSFQLSHTACI